MKALRRSFLCSNFAEYAVLAKSTSFWLAFLHRNLTWGSNGSWLSKWISRSFSHLLLEMTIPSILIWISCVYFVGRCDFSGFTFRRLSMNLRVKYLRFFLDCVIPYSYFYQLSGDYYHLSTWNKSQKNMLNSNGLSMEPCGNPKIISDH